MPEVRATANLRGERIDLVRLWAEPEAPRSQLRLVRRRRAYPEHARDGALVLDTGELLRDGPTGQLWGRLDRLRFVDERSGAEEGLTQLELVLFYPESAGPQPEVARLRYFDEPTQTDIEVAVAPQTRLWTALARHASGDATLTWTVRRESGGTTTDVGTLEVQLLAEAGVAGHLVRWVPSAGPAVPLHFDGASLERHRVLVDERPDVAWQARIEVDRLDLAAFVRSGGTLSALHEAPFAARGRVVLADQLDPDTGFWRRRVEVEDRALAGEVEYFYRFFDAAATATPPWEERACAVAGGVYGGARQLYERLPSFVRGLDEPDPSAPEEGQLRRFLSLFGAGFDHARGLSEALRSRHDPTRAPAYLLPALSRLIGWEPDRAQSELRQRRDLLFAPEIFETVGTRANLCALVNRITGWECRPKELVHNVCMTNVPEGIGLWDLWTARFDGTPWSEPERLTGGEAASAYGDASRDAFDGRPAAHLEAGGTLRLYWHSDRADAGWEVLSSDLASPPVLVAGGDGANRNHPLPLTVGAATWLFFDSDVSGARDVWCERPGGLLQNLSEHAADDRRPHAVTRGAEVWVFWSSDRRGPTDVWYRVYNGTEWALPPQRATATEHGDEDPCAVVVGSDLWLFFSRDRGGRSALFAALHDGSAWAAAEELAELAPATGERAHEQAPHALVNAAGELQLFWHSDRGGRHNLYTSRRVAGAWTAPEPLTARPQADKEPWAVLDSAGVVHLFWRSQRRGRLFQSRTFDFSDAVDPVVDRRDAYMVRRMGQIDDRAHYTYDTGREDHDLYARETVAVYLYPPEGTAEDELERTIERLRAFVEPFRPVPTRLVFLRAPDEVQPPVTPEPIVEAPYDENFDVMAWMGDAFDDELG